MLDQSDYNFTPTPFLVAISTQESQLSIYLKAIAMFNIRIVKTIYALCTPLSNAFLPAPLLTAGCLENQMVGFQCLVDRRHHLGEGDLESHPGISRVSFMVRI